MPDPTYVMVMQAIDRFERNLAFTAPELTEMRIEQLRSEMRGIFGEDE